MRYLFLSVVLVVGLMACKQSVKGTNGVAYKSATDYNDYIVNRQTTLIKRVMEFGKVADVNLDSAQALLTKSVKEVETMIGEIKGMPPYKGDSSLRNAAIASFSFYKKVFEKDYATILNIRKKGEGNITPEDAVQANSIIENITKEEEGLDKTFQSAQRDFASKNSMQLKDNKVQKDLEKELEKMGKE
jgi:predicted ribosome quality control (RQC) complex YloA/Tae2 family protein